jgi:ribonuclease P protein component
VIVALHDTCTTGESRPGRSAFRGPAMTPGGSRRRHGLRTALPSLLRGVESSATVLARRVESRRLGGGARLAAHSGARYHDRLCQRAVWADAHAPSLGSTGEVSSAGTEEAMSEANISTEQPQAGEAARVSPSDVDPSRTGDHQGSASEGPPAPVGLIWRVDRRDTFEALRHGRRCRQGPITLAWIAGDPTEPPRVAYTIGRRVGPAVVRNRLRRRLRAVIRESAAGLRPGAYLIGAGPGAVALSYDELRRDLLKALRCIETQ